MPVQTSGPKTGPDGATPAPSPKDTVLFYSICVGPVCRCHPVTVYCRLLSNLHSRFLPNPSLRRLSTGRLSAISTAYTQPIGEH